MYSRSFNSVVKYMHWRSFNTVKRCTCIFCMQWGTCTQEDSIKWSNEPVLNKIKKSEMMSMYSRSFNSVVKYMHWWSFNTVKRCTCTEEVSIECSKVHVLKKIQYIEVKYIHSRIFITLKWGICTQEASIQIIEKHILKKFKYSELKYWTKDVSIEWSEIHVLKKIQYSVENYMYSKSLNSDVKCIVVNQD